MQIRGQLHLRGTFRWKWKRITTIIRGRGRELNNLPIVIGNAIPKSGSKMLFNILRGLTDLAPFIDTTLNEIKPFTDGEPTRREWIHKELLALQPGDIRFGYFYPESRIKQIISSPSLAHFFIIRDPRDALVSSVFYAMDINPDQFHHDYISNLPDMEERLSFAIKGDAQGEYAMSHVGDRYARWYGWLENPDVCLIRFEELVSDRENQLDRMIAYLENRGFSPDLSRAEMVQILLRQMAPGKSGTFRKGISGEWKRHFSSRTTAEFKSFTGDLLVKMGYEKDSSW